MLNKILLKSWIYIEEDSFGQERKRKVTWLNGREFVDQETKEVWVSKTQGRKSLVIWLIFPCLK
jgi:hypothetical protein